MGKMLVKDIVIFNIMITLVFRYRFQLNRHAKFSIWGISIESYKRRISLDRFYDKIFSEFETVGIGQTRHTIKATGWPIYILNLTGYWHPTHCEMYKG